MKLFKKCTFIFNIGSSLATHVSLQGGKDFEDGLGI